MFECEWVRDVRLGTQHVALLRVAHCVDLGVFDAYVGHAMVGRTESLHTATAAAELAYCNARVLHVP